jgi:GNAT superfamily N-acetyltransferase
VKVDLDPVRLRDAYDAQLRAWMPDQLPPGATLVQDGPVRRLSGVDERGFVTYVSVADLERAQLDVLIARQRDVFAAEGQAVEWKLHGHDEPSDLAERLRVAGFEPEEQETVLIGLAEPLADADPALPDGIRLRAVTSRADLDRIAAMESAVWDADRSFLATALERELAADPSGTTVVVAEATSGEVVCAGWIRYIRETAFATLWGGSTLPAWRGQGIYKALVAYRAHLATTRGHQMLQVDASDDSRPILQRCGLVAVTTTTPYVFTPAPAQ